jgi:hypothetical protein
VTKRMMKMMSSTNLHELDVAVLGALSIKLEETIYYFILLDF